MAAITKETESLIRALGVREDCSPEPLLALIRKKKVSECIQAIPTQLGLPVHIDLEMVVTGKSQSGAFVSHEMASTDRDGHGTQGISAQVHIPPSLPLYGSQELTGYPIAVRISQSDTRHPETLIAIAAHELSHVLLHSLLHPGRRDEVVTDLVPLVMGLGHIVETGRKVVRVTRHGNVLRTRTSTYGYLSDEDFAAALECVERSRQYHRPTGQALGRSARDLQQLTREAAADWRRLSALLARSAGAGGVSPGTTRLAELRSSPEMSVVREFIDSAEQLATKALELASGTHYSDRSRAMILMMEQDVHRASLKMRAHLVQLSKDIPSARKQLSRFQRIVFWVSQLVRWS